MLQKIFDNKFVGIHKSKVTLKLNKPAYGRSCILDLSKVLIYEFHYDYIKNKYGNNNYSVTLIVWCMELKPKTFMRILVRITKCLI